MEIVKFANVCESDLAALFGKGTPTIRAWVRAGMPRNQNGSFSLPAVIRWRERQREAEMATVLKPDRLTQEQLAGLLGCTRQTVTAWGWAGLPRRKDNHYGLGPVCCWLRAYYASSAKREYQARLENVRKKIHRNVAQLERFFDKEIKL